MATELDMLLQNPIFEGLAPSDFEGVELLWENSKLVGRGVPMVSGAGGLMSWRL